MLTLNAVAIELSTVQNSPLSVPAAFLASSNFTGSPDLAGERFVLASVSSATREGGSAVMVRAQSWVRRYDGGAAGGRDSPFAMVVRTDGSVVVTGASQGASAGDDFATVCHAPDGSVLWTRRYDGPAHDDDTARLLAVNATGDVWVVGESRRSTADDLLSDVVTLKYASNGIPAWTNRYAGAPTNAAYPTALAVDESGNAYVEHWETHWESGVGSPVQSVITKYDPLGEVAWRKVYPRTAPNSGQDIHDPGPLALDDAGSLLVAGTTGSPFFLTGSSIVKHGDDGTALWTRHFPSLQLMDGIYLLSTGRDGEILATGQRWEGGTRLYVMIKLAGDGTPLWTNFLAGPQYDGGNMPRTEIDSAGDVFVVGGGHGAVSAGLYQALKISRLGMPLWTNQLTMFHPPNNPFTASVVDDAGRLHVAGSAMRPGGGFDYLTATLDGDGRALWTNQFGGEANESDFLTALAVDAGNHLHVTGRAFFGAGDADYVTIQYRDLIHYTPPPGFTGSDAITCELADSQGNRATGEVVVVVVPGQLRFDLSGSVFGPAPGGISWRIEVVPGTNVVVVEASPDLKVWTPILTNAPVGGAVQFEDPPSEGIPRRHYRAFQRP